MDGDRNMRDRNEEKGIRSEKKIRQKERGKEREMYVKIGGEQM